MVAELEGVGRDLLRGGKWVLCDRGRGAVGVEQVSRKGG